MPTADPPPAHSFGSITVNLVHDDIADRKADALVNAASTRLEMAWGVSGALLARGGVEIHHQAIAHAPAPLGSVLRTRPGTLATRYIYHAVVVEPENREGAAVGDVIAAVRGVLACALTDGARTLAMPLLGAGRGGLGASRSLEAMLEAIEDVSAAYTWELAIDIVVRNAQEFTEAATVFREFGQKASREAEDAQLEADFLKLVLRKQ
jgi:O-acetyl-ADP-ribose deacetylase (regulator of RNase III)